MFIPSYQQWFNSTAEDRVPLPYYPSGDIRIGLVNFNDATQTFEIFMGVDYAETYDMHCDRLLAGKTLLDFLLLIHTKEWITGQHLMDLLNCIGCWIHRDHNGAHMQTFFDVEGELGDWLGH